MENGPSNHNGEEKQIWERPWTLEEMRQSSANWSLAADSGLFLFLQDFSQRMLSKTHEIEKQLDGLIRDTKATDSCLHTVFNDFLMLSNTQFIENRVYDEEIEEPPAKPEAPERPSEQEKTREQKEAELIPKVQEAVNYGLQVLDSAFEQLDIKAGNSDSEDEEATDRVEPILEPKDLYVDRPLPYLIGSQLFMETDDVGLGDLSSEEMSIDSDPDSVAESEEGKDRDQSDEDFDQEEDGQGSFKKKSSMLSSEDEEEEDEDSDIFGESDKEEDGEGKTSAGPPSFADELAARIKGEPVNKPEPARPASSSISSMSKKSKGNKPARPQVEEDVDDDELFKPPKMEDDDYSPFGGKGGLFSGGRGLFDDDDEGDLFSEAPRQEPKERGPSSETTTEPVKSKKIPSSAVSVFPDNKLFSSPNDSDSIESKEASDPYKPQPPPMPKMGGGGLFDEDDEEDDDFFGGRTVKKTSSKVQDSAKSKKTVDLFGGEDGDDGDIFSEGSSAAATQTSRKEPPVDGNNTAQVPEKKLPAGAISMFGPGTTSLLVEGLRKRQPSTSEESEKSENDPSLDIKPAVTKSVEKKAQSRGLFSDDEDSQIFPSMTKSQSKPEPTTQAKPSKAASSIFDDEEEEDLFSSAPKPKSTQPQTAKQVSKPATSSLFSDDEDPWASSTTAPVKPEVKTGGMKASVSAPSCLPSAKATKKVSLFDDDDGDDLFAATKETSQKKPQRVSLLFEDETEDDEKDSLFGFKPATNNTSTTAKVVPVDPQGPSQPATKTPDEKVPASVPEEAPTEKAATEQRLQSPPQSLAQEAEEPKKKPAGAVSLFGGIDVLSKKPAVLQEKRSLLEEDDGDDFLSEDSQPPLAKSGKKTTLSLFDNDNDDEDEDDETNGGLPVPVSTKPTVKNTLKESRSGIRSTGVFQDEELLFSQTQQRDNDPDVDLFAASVKSASPLPASVKPAASALFGDEEEDDLFASTKPKVPPKVAEKSAKPKKDESPVKTINATASAEKEQGAKPVEPKGLSSRIGQLQANLNLNPSSLLPGAAPRIPGAVGVLPGLALPSAASSSSVSPSPSLFSPVGTPSQPHTPTEMGVSFDSPAQVNTLQSANKGRTKGMTRRRPQTRAARHLAVQHSEEQGDMFPEASASSGEGPSPAAAPSLPTSSLSSPLPTSLFPTAASPLEEDTTAQAAVRPKRPPMTAPVPDDGGDLFGSDDLFAPAPKLAPSPKPKTKTPVEVPASTPDKDPAPAPAPAPSIFDDQGDDLFGTVKPKPQKKAQAVAYLEEDDEDDLFGIGKSVSNASVGKESNVGGSAAKQDIFQDKIETTPKATKKLKEKAVDASLFDDNVDIFADLTPKTKPKEKKSKKKVETKSIFDDDMDDIFSSGPTKPAAKAPSKAKKTQPALDPSSTEDSSSSIFDDPLNVLGGN